MMDHIESTNYSVRLNMMDGNIQESNEWTSHKVAKKIAANIYDKLVNVTNTGVQSIEIIDTNEKSIQLVKMN